MSSSYDISYEYCDADALPAETTSITSLERNQFYKICPGLHLIDGTIAPLGQPRCGDGSNYSFMVTRPKKESQEAGGGGEKILIELSGGGACWDSLTCSLQSFWLSFPVFYNALVGTSCDSMDSAMLSDRLLCNRKIGDTDLSEYTSVFIPYCTQDVHFGDQPTTSYGVRHVGAHNIKRTLNWIFKNFPNPKDIFITGCSAGATPLPIIYDLVNKHYDLGGDQAVNIDVIADSAVFLTPKYFLENSISNWNINTLLQQVGFNFDAYKNDDSFPMAILDHSLQRSKKTDDIGYVSHDADQISLYYFKLMSGNLLSQLFGRDRELSLMIEDMYKMGGSKFVSPDFHHRRLNDDVEMQWWDKMNTSMANAMESHSNFDSFVMEGTGHCSFGLNVPLEYAGFEEWAASLLQGPIETTTPVTPESNGVVDNSTAQSSPTIDTSSESNSSIAFAADSANIATGHVPSSFSVIVMILLSWRLVR